MVIFTIIYRFLFFLGKYIYIFISIYGFCSSAFYFFLILSPISSPLGCGGVRYGAELPSGLNYITLVLFIYLFDFIVRVKVSNYGSFFSI